MRSYDVGFFSSPDRGLECLLDMIPKIEEKLGRKIKSVWAYGWNSFDVMHAKNPAMMKWKWQIIRKMNDVGMESKGRLSHVELAKLMKDTKVWAYPTEFTEIHCITALKAQEAGCTPVITNVAALKETVISDSAYVTASENIYTDEASQATFITEVVDAIEHGYGIPEKDRVPDRYWPDVAKVWSEALV